VTDPENDENVRWELFFCCLLGGGGAGGVQRTGRTGNWQFQLKGGGGGGRNKKKSKQGKQIGKRPKPKVPRTPLALRSLVLEHLRSVEGAARISNGEWELTGVL
jgi:hypothetical protein